jgi:hypothetical protein
LLETSSTTFEHHGLIEAHNSHYYLLTKLCDCTVNIFQLCSGFLNLLFELVDFNGELRYLQIGLIALALNLVDMLHFLPLILSLKQVHIEEVYIFIVLLQILQLQCEALVLNLEMSRLFLVHRGFLGELNVV